MGLRRRTSIFTAVGVALIIGAGSLAWYVGSQKDTVDNESATASQTVSEDAAESPQAEQELPKSDETVRNGTFSGLAPKTGSGSVTVSAASNKTFSVTLGDDFTVQDGPDLYVGFGNNGHIDAATLFATLKATSGAQTYEVPSTIDIAGYDQIFIYCKQYATPFAVANF